MTDTAMTINHETNSATIRESAQGWLVTLDSRWQGAWSGRRILIPYTDHPHGYERGVDLHAPHNAWLSIGEALVVYAREADPRDRGVCHHVRVIRTGYRVR